MNRPRPLILTTLIALALAAPARADVIQWGYTTSLATGSGASSGASSTVITADAPATGTIQLTGSSNSNLTGSNTFVPVGVQILTASAGTNNLSTNGNYTLFVTLTDTASGMTDTMTFSGKLGGSFTANSSELLTSTLFDPSVQSATIGTHLYTVSIGNYGYVPPSPPGSVTTGSIGGYVQVSSVPEPSSLLLGGLGLVGGGFLGLRRRRRARASC